MNVDFGMDGAGACCLLVHKRGCTYPMTAKWFSPVRCAKSGVVGERNLELRSSIHRCVPRGQVALEDLHALLEPSVQIERSRARLAAAAFRIDLEIERGPVSPQSTRTVTTATCKHKHVAEPVNRDNTGVRQRENNAHTHACVFVCGYSGSTDVVHLKY